MKKVLKFGVFPLAIIVILVLFFNLKQLTIISGFSAKSMASGLFVAGGTQNSIDSLDNGFSPINLAENKIDAKNKSVTSKIFGLKPRTAVYRKGLGTVLVNEDYNPDDSYLTPKRNLTTRKLPFPYGNLPQKDTVFSTVNYKKLENVIDAYFAENSQKNTTKSLLIIYKNQIIGERYADGFSENTLLLGWSMTKSLMSAVYGVLDKKGLVDVNDPAPVEAWKNDERSKITINNLLQMNSGLEWEEDYTKISDVTKMLYLETDMTKSQIDKPLVGQPNNSWRYSSGTSNLLAGIIRQKFKTHQQYLDFWYTELIDKIGMNSMLVEADLAGNYIASTYAWATTRDWAKFGLLYLNNGNWSGEQLFDKDWVDYSKRPTNSSQGVYGAQFWLNAGGHLPDVPKDMYMADGYQGQRVFIIPSKELVVVRMGVTYSTLKEKLKKRKIKPSENRDVVEYELNNIESNLLLKNVLSAIE